MKIKTFLTTITPFSRVLTAVLFVILPLVGFLLGMRYQDLVNSANDANIYYMLQQPDIRTQQPLVLKQYTIPAFDASFAYPESWTLKTNVASGMNLLKTVTGTMASSSNVPQIALQKWSKGALIKTADDIKAELMKLDSKSTPKAVTVDKEMGYAVTKTSTDGAVMIDTYFMTPKNDVLVLSLMYGDLASQRVYNSVLSSFRFAVAPTGAVAK